MGMEATDTTMAIVQSIVKIRQACVSAVRNGLAGWGGDRCRCGVDQIPTYLLLCPLSPSLLLSFCKTRGVDLSQPSGY